MAAPKGYWKLVRNICNKYGILLHLDEVMCGMGRTGTYYAFEQEEVIPDVVTIGKGLGGGYAPIAGILINRKIVDALRIGSSAFNHGQTYQAHPTSCATALAVQKIVHREGLVAKCAKSGETLGRLLREAFPPQLAFGSKVQLAAFDLGVAVYPGARTIDGHSGDHVLLAPPFTAMDNELVHIVSVLKRAYDQIVASVVIV
jgi:adenosylmethionine-8-amino-7-oxononanoate aminotransferase